MKTRILGISILDSVVTFVLTTNNHSDDRNARLPISALASFQDLYQRLMTTPPFDVLKSNANQSALEPYRSTLIHLYRK